ncbi:hypothetical protein NIES2130_22570 [Scytonema sp. HK-05]|nr:hypothetical protein NIES2130_22570 [Scytonema sp. HK-05]
MFDKPSLIVHLGFDQANVATSDWYTQKGHPYVQAISQILDELVTLPYIQKLEFLISPGVEPLSNLQVQLDRQTFSAGTLPSSVPHLTCIILAGKMPTPQEFEKI